MPFFCLHVFASLNVRQIELVELDKVEFLNLKKITLKTKFPENKPCSQQTRFIFDQLYLFFVKYCFFPMNSHYLINFYFFNIY